MRLLRFFKPHSLANGRPIGRCRDHDLTEFLFAPEGIPRVNAGPVHRFSGNHVRLVERISPGDLHALEVVANGLARVSGFAIIQSSSNTGPEDICVLLGFVERGKDGSDDCRPADEMLRGRQVIQEGCDVMADLIMIRLHEGNDFVDAMSRSLRCIIAPKPVRKASPDVGNGPFRSALVLVRSEQPSLRNMPGTARRSAVDEGVQLAEVLFGVDFVAEVADFRNP